MLVGLLVSAAAPALPTPSAEPTAIIVTGERVGRPVRESPRTTIVVDGRAVTYNEFVFGPGPLWDVERVEVYRSPQTTTQGVNSIAGAIFAFSEDPKLDRSEFKGRLIGGDYRTHQASAAAAAQASPSDAPTSIIVTGERTKRSLKDTASSVAVFDERDLKRLAAPDRIQNVLAMVPNVLVATSRDAPVIRGQIGVGVLQGLPAFLGGARPRTVMQIDGRTVTFNEFVD